MFQRHDQRAMPAHRVAEHTLPVHAQREMGGDQRRKLFADIAVHAVIGVPRRFGSIDIEAGTAAEGPVILVRNILAARAGIGTDDRDAKLGRHAPVFTLFHDIGMGAGQARQVPQHRHRPVLGLRRQVDGKGHVASGDAGGMAVDALDAAKGLLGGKRFHIDRP